jgi:hypothetical protein
MLPFWKPMPRRSVNGWKYGMVTKTWKKKIIYPLDHLKAMMPWTLSVTNELGGIRYFVWFLKTIVFSFSLLVSWIFQLRKLFIDCAASNILYWPTSSLSWSSWWPSHCYKRWSTREHGWIHWQMEICPFSKCTIPRVQWQKNFLIMVMNGMISQDAQKPQKESFPG